MNNPIEYNDAWSISIVSESEDGYLVQATNGDTYWMSHEDYDKYNSTKKIVKE